MFTKRHDFSLLFDAYFPLIYFKVTILHKSGFLVTSGHKHPTSGLAGGDSPKEHTEDVNPLIRRLEFLMLMCLGRR